MDDIARVISELRLLDLYFDALWFDLFSLGQGQFQHAVFKGCLSLVGICLNGQGNYALEGAIASLTEVILTFLFLLLAFLVLSLDSQSIAHDGYVYFIRVEARQRSFDHQVVVCLVHVES
jgi:hypothetical protein